VAYSQQTQDSQIYRVTFDPVSETIQGNAVPITRGAKQYGSPDASPDGRDLAFNCEDKICVSKTDASALRTLTNGTAKNWWPRWYPDGRRIGFMSNRTGRPEIWIIDSDGSGLRQISFTEGEAQILGFAWSPDGKRLVCTRSGLRADILEADVAWKEQKAIPIAPYSDRTVQFLGCRWSPDGRQLAFSTGGKGSFVYEIATGVYRRLSEGYEREPVWLNDNRRVILESPYDVSILDTLSGRKKLLFSVSPKYTNPAAISPDNHTIFYPTWSPEADIWIAELKR
jgi:Tol biopolymer transport system component